MYYFLEGPRYVSSNYIANNITNIISSKTFYYSAILSESHVYIYEQKTNTFIGFYGRSSESLDVYGFNKSLEWSMDSQQIAISTTKCSVLLYSINFENQNSTDDSERSLNLFTVQTFLPCGCNIQYLDVITFQSPITSLSLYRGDIIIGTNNGCLNRIKWDGRILYNQQMQLQDLSFFNDLEFSKDSRSFKCDSSCKDIEWFPSWNGLVVLFDNGKGAFLHIPNHTLNSKYVTGVWAENLNQATCVAVNVKFRSVAFGCQNGNGIIYKFDEETGALRIQHILQISNTKYPDASNNIGSVQGLKWSPDNFCLVLFWESGDFSLWSAQGFLLFCSLGNSFGDHMHFISMDWGCEGYSLCGISKSNNSEQFNPQMVIYSMTKSSLINNSTLYNQRHMILVGSTSFLVGLRNHLINSFDPLVYIKYPEIYLAHNWPIKFVSINEDANKIVIAGRCGFCIYFVKKQKWRFFGNELEESSMEIVGGIVWYKKFICLACFDNKKDEFEIRIYDSEKKIDDSSCMRYSIKDQILILNGYHETVITLTINGHVTLYNIKCEIIKGVEKINLISNQFISLENYIDFAACVVSLHLSSIHSEIGSDDLDENTYEYKSLLVNYSGHLLMFQKDKYYVGKHKNSLPQSTSKDSIHKHKDFCFSGPLVVAYNVENIWVPYFEKDSSYEFDPKTYTMENSLWINCGSLGLKVWLSLKTSSMKNEYKVRNSFLSKRIMLICKIPDFYPLVVLNSNILLLALNNEFNMTNKSINPLPIIEIKHHIFIHHLIKQLLKINLGVHALDLTNDLKDLSYFNHALELLLHEVLEEEATSKEPIPDPLLPRVIAFTQEFPDFLKIVVQCARKTELALWSYLFESAGDPKDLFENCLENNKPEVAASYLVILQNTEPPFMSQQHAVILLTSALYQMKWSLVKDLIRFLKNIALNDSNLSTSNSKMDTNTPFVRLHKKRFRSGGYSNTVTTSSNTNSRKYNHANPPLTATASVMSQFTTKTSSFNSSTNNPTMQNSLKSVVSRATEKLKEEMFVDTNNAPNSSLGLPSPTVKSTPVSFQDDLQKQSITNSIGHGSSQNKSSLPDISTSFFNETISPNKSPTYSNDFIGFESIKTSNLVRDIDQIITRFAHELFQDYRIFTLFELVANVGFTESQFKNWLIRERDLCSKISDPFKAFTRLHKDFGWDDMIKKYQSDLNNRYEDNEYLSISKEFVKSKIHKIQEQKIRYSVNVLCETKYWEWTILLLIMLNNGSQIITVLECIRDSELPNIVEFIHKLLDQLDINEYGTYHLILSQILPKLETFINYGISEEPIEESGSNEENVDCNDENEETMKHDVDINGDKYDETVLLSPPANHMFTLGQLEIDLENNQQYRYHLNNKKFDNHEQIVQQCTTEKLPPIQTPNGISIKFNNRKESNKSSRSSLVGHLKSPPHDLLTSFKLLQDDDDDDNDENGNIITKSDNNNFEHLISNELDDSNHSSSTWCSVS